MTEQEKQEKIELSRRLKEAITLSLELRGLTVDSFLTDFGATKTKYYSWIASNHENIRAIRAFDIARINKHFIDAGIDLNSHPHGRAFNWVYVLTGEEITKYEDELLNKQDFLISAIAALTTVFEPSSLINTLRANLPERHNEEIISLICNKASLSI